MPFFAVLISDPAAPALDERLAARLRDALEGEAPRWLMPQVACEIAFAPRPGVPHPVAGELRDHLDGRPVDIAIVPAAQRRKRLLVADMDSTIIGQECIDEIADLVGLKPEIAAITERAMRGEIAFEPALRERVKLLAGISRNALDRLTDERITLNPGARTLIATMRAHGAHTALVSGGFTLFTAAIAARAGFDEHLANRLILDGDRLAGTVAEPILGRQAKRAALEAIARRLGLATPDTMAVGDGANDLAMLDAAGLGIAYHAKPAVAAAADIRIDHGDLTALLFVQGYAAADFAA